MNDADSYWRPVCELVSQLRCWVRVAWREGATTQQGWWGQLLTIPTSGYLEAAGGPTPLRDVEWVEVSMRRVKGGIAGRSLELVDAKDEILVGLLGIQARWELRETTWSLTKVFVDEPVEVARIENPFGPVSRPSKSKGSDDA